MSQSTLIVGALILGFVFYITAQGELSSYLGVFYGATQSTATGSATTTVASGVGNLAGLASLNQDFSGGSSDLAVTGNQDFSG